MFFSKFKNILIIFFIFSIKLYSQPSHFQTLQLDYIREEISSTGESAKMAGHIVYQSSPAIFIFETTSPVSQIAYSNSDGTYLIQADILYDYSEGEEVLLQTCKDILTWFKKDCDLAVQGYVPWENWKENSMLATKWRYGKIGVHPFESIIVYSDSNGRFRKLQMYTTEECLFAETILDAYENYMGIAYPKEITTYTFNDDKIFATTKLSFSKVKINKQIKQDYAGTTLLVKDSEEKSPIQVKKSKAITPEVEKFTTSTVMMAVNTSYAFYKKFITKQDHSACPFEPSCSQYMLEAVSKHGPFGIIMGLERLKRCTSYEHSRNLYPVVNGNHHADPVP